MEKKEDVDELHMFTFEASKVMRVGVDSTQKGTVQEFNIFRRYINDIVKLDALENKYVLKVLRKPTDARDAGLAKERIKREIKAMQDVNHKNLIELVEFDKDNQEWFVAKYYCNKTLADNRKQFEGKLFESLVAIRPLIEGVAEIHRTYIDEEKKHAYVHRDIKPQNIFIDEKYNLVLGDFGLVYINEGTKRVSLTFDNVGSWNWMPPWAENLRWEDVVPNFDVYSLGKVLCSMISGKSLIQHHYGYGHPAKKTLPELFPEENKMYLVHEMLRECVVYEEIDCKINDAGELLKRVDMIIKEIKGTNNREILSMFDKNGKEIERKCRVCSRGIYKEAVGGKALEEIEDFGIRPKNRNMIVYTCDTCAHVELFSYKHDDKMPPVWRKSTLPGHFPNIFE